MVVRSISVCQEVIPILGIKTVVFVSAWAGGGISTTAGIMRL